MLDCLWTLWGNINDYLGQGFSAAFGTLSQGVSSLLPCFNLRRRMIRRRTTNLMRWHLVKNFK
jgi:hypothetical protein